MTTQTRPPPPPTSAAQRTLGVVSFLNAVPLVCGMDHHPNLVLSRNVPSALCTMLLDGRCDAALLPVVDYKSHADVLTPVSDACIASDGETLTVRVYSTVPAEHITRLCVDADSHTSVILAQILWRELYGRTLELVPPSRRHADAAPDANAVLLIGDKVVAKAPRGYGFIVDLGAAWKHLTGLPFVFAAWYARTGEDLKAIATALEAARDEGVRRAEELAATAADMHGWPVDTAVVYLRDIMKYTMTLPMRAGLRCFFDMMDRHGLST